MTIGPDEAAASLDDITRTQRRTREAVYYGASSGILLLWGLSWCIGNSIAFVSPRHAQLGWLIIDALGVALSILIVARPARARPGSRDWRIVVAFIVLMGFGFFWQWLLGQQQWREINVFWPTLFMMGYIIAGLWIGRFFTICGTVVTALIVAGYLWSGPFLPLWLAIIGGGSLILGGLWLRRVGAPQ